VSDRQRGPNVPANGAYRRVTLGCDETTAVGRASLFPGERGKDRNRRVSLIHVRPREGRLTEPTAVTQPWRDRLSWVEAV
jgi:hypothetical protein